MCVNKAYSLLTPVEDVLLIVVLLVVVLVSANGWWLWLLKLVLLGGVGVDDGASNIHLVSMDRASRQTMTPLSNLSMKFSGVISSIPVFSFKNKQYFSFNYTQLENRVESKQKEMSIKLINVVVNISTVCSVCISIYHISKRKVLWTQQSSRYARVYHITWRRTLRKPVLPCLSQKLRRIESMPRMRAKMTKVCIANIVYASL